MQATLVDAPSHHEQGAPNLELTSTFKLVSTSISSIEEVRKRSIEKHRPSLQIEFPKELVSATPVQAEIVKQVAKDAVIDYHMVQLAELCTTLKSDTQHGVTENDAKERLKHDGHNTLTVKSYRWILNVLYTFFGGLNSLLWLASILCILAYQPFGGANPDPVNIGLAIVLWIVNTTQGVFTLYQDWSSSKAMNSIKNMMPELSTVIREGRVAKIATKDIVAGDIVKVVTGDRVPADLRIIEMNQLKIDNSVLTGESEPISCSLTYTDSNYMESKNLLFMGCTIVEGNGTGICVATGQRSVMGKVARLASTTRKGASTLRRHMNRLVIGVAITGLVLALCLIIFWVAFLRTTYPNFMSLSGLISGCIALIVSIVPEGLPISLTLALTVSAKNMFRENVLVKSLPTVETLGAIDVIASDKTGTLTQNKMRVSSVYSADRLLETSQVFHHIEQNDVAIKELVQALALCNRASFESGDNVPIEQRSVIGDASDTAFLIFAEQFVRVNSVRATFPLLAEIPFHSKNKWMLSIAKTPSGPVLYMKGASEIMLEKCTTIMTSDGSSVPLTEDVKKKISQQIDELCNQGQRVLAIAYTKLDTSTYNESYVYDTEKRNFPTEALCFLGLMALFDPPRPDVPHAITVCKNAGISVMMVTGDHHSTAVAIAKMIGLVTKSNVTRVTADSDVDELEKEDKNYDHALVIRGEDVPSFEKKEWKFIFKHEEVVFARTTPEHKLIIVRECQANKHIVAVTGDGVNDAPALKQANVGIAIGEGSDVAREAADIVLMDSRFSSIVKGIEYGRLVFENLRKVIIYVFPAGNWAEMLPIFVSTFFGVPLPLSPFLMICICVATDIATTLSLIMEQPEGDLMKRPPYTKTGESLVDIRLFIHAFLFLGNIEAIGAFSMYFLYFWWYAGIAPNQIVFAFDKWTDGYLGKSKATLDEHLYVAQSIYFASLTMIQFGNLMATRTQRLSFFQQLPFVGKNKNLYLFLGILISCTIAIFFLYLPVFQIVFYTREIPAQFWFIPMGFALLLFVLDEFRKIMTRLCCTHICKSKRSH